MKKETNLNRLDQTVFYALDKAIKSYRKFAQRNIKNKKLDITIDQWLVLKTIADNPGFTQKEIAEAVFKDYASITRMIELLVKKEFLIRSFHDTDRRRYQLVLGPTGKKIYKKAIPVVLANRTAALNGFSDKEVKILFHLLQKLTKNCQNKPDQITIFQTP